MNVIEDVADSVSEIGVLYLSAENRRFMKKKFDEKNLEFHKLGDSYAFVCVYRDHPLADQKTITCEDLRPYPNVIFGQGSQTVGFTAKDNAENQKIQVNDRMTMLNMMRALNGYTICSGVFPDGLDDGNYVVIPYEGDSVNNREVVEIGWISQRHAILSEIGQEYIRDLEQEFRCDRHM